MKKDTITDLSKDFVPSIEKRRTLKLALGTFASLAVFQRPIINAIIPSAHASPHLPYTPIPVDRNLRGKRIILRSRHVDETALHAFIVDSNDNVLANCCEGEQGIVIANDLKPGVYRIFAASNGPGMKEMNILRTAMAARFYIDGDLVAGTSTNSETDNFLVATVEMPSGQIVRH